MRCSIDIETYSSADIKATGAYAYAEAPDFEILLIGYRFQDEPETTVIDISEMTVEEAVWYVESEYPRFFNALHDPDVLCTAFNANFERTCLSKYFGYMEPEQWQCTMVRAAMLGLPMNLAGVGEVLGLSEDKLKLSSGKALIQYFCKPCKPTKANGGRTRNLPKHSPEKWNLFVEYNARDVDSEMEILRKIDEFGPMLPQEAKTWAWDQRTNDYGVMLDIPYVEGILEENDRYFAALLEEAKEITHLENPNSVSQFKDWLSARGVTVAGVTKAAVAEALKGPLPDDVRRALEIRQALGKTSTKKYKAMTNAVCNDGRLRGILQFYGANRTGRFAGRIVQTHNLPQNHLDDIQYCRELVKQKDFEAVEMIYGDLSFVFSQLVRTAFTASPGNRFVVCDYSAVEARILSWLSNERWRMEVFETGGDIYCASASMMYHVPVEKHGQNSHLRQRGKVAELALGYQGGVGAMKNMDTTGSIPESEMQGIVNDWRNASPNVVKLWNRLEKATTIAIARRRPESDMVKVAVGKDHCAYVGFYMKKGALFMRLPSGRCLVYWKAHLKTMDDGREHICYEGMNQTSKHWETAETYGGKLVENACQAIGRDLLCEAMLAVADMGYRVVMHVHDEMIVDVPKEDTEAYARISAAMGVTPEWAKGLCLRGDGYETEFYLKD